MDKYQGFRIVTLSTVVSILSACGGGSSTNKDESEIPSEPLNQIQVELSDLNDCLISTNAEADFERTDLSSSYRHLVWNCSVEGDMLEPKRLEYVPYYATHSGCYKIRFSNPLVGEANCDEPASVPDSLEKEASIISFDNVVFHRRSNTVTTYYGIGFEAEIINTGEVTAQWSVSIKVPGILHPISFESVWIIPGETKKIVADNYNISFPLDSLYRLDYSVHLMSSELVDSTTPEGRYREIYQTLPMPEFSIINMPVSQ